MITLDWLPVFAGISLLILAWLWRFWHTGKRWHGWALIALWAVLAVMTEARAVGLLPFS